MHFTLKGDNPLEGLALLGGVVPVVAFEMAASIVQTRAVMAAVRLGLLEALVDGPFPADALAEKLGLHAETTELLLRTVAATGYLELSDDGSFALNKKARRWLLSGSDESFCNYVMLNYYQWAWLDHLEGLVQRGESLDVHGTQTDPHYWKVYQGAMLEFSRMAAPVVASAVPVPSGARRMLDLGGSHGAIGAAICRQHPPMTSVVLDLPSAVEAAQPLAEAAGVTDVVSFQRGDVLTDELGSGYDLVLMANLVHHFDPEQAESVLARARRAAAPGAVVAIWEFERPAGKPHGLMEAGALFFRLTSSAAAYTADDYRGWLERSGFERVEVKRPLKAPGQVLVCGRVPS